MSAVQRGEGGGGTMCSGSQQSGIDGVESSTGPMVQMVCDPTNRGQQGSEGQPWGSGPMWVASTGPIPKGRRGKKRKELEGSFKDGRHVVKVAHNCIFLPEYLTQNSSHFSQVNRGDPPDL